MSDKSFLINTENGKVGIRSSIWSERDKIRHVVQVFYGLSADNDKNFTEVGFVRTCIEPAAPKSVYFQHGLSGSTKVTGDILSDGKLDLKSILTQGEAVDIFHTILVGLANVHKENEAESDAEKLIAIIQDKVEKTANQLNYD